ncbi:hypothetical protein [Streptomyces sp. MH60]|uniref:hypothetical protein n=1 Tax=Streptomyces sp. MH60 TaxID=1940758 RepID=UPI000CEEACEE|nr:hypothetical protein [Streptomyces sp. MH60]PPS89406.1 hypothetical protein BZZ08_01552 [Streptomyces sp. MH60]
MTLSTAYLASQPARGPGLDQATARRRARELAGIAAAAHKDSNGRWNTDGWPTDQTAWIVTSLAGRIILDDGSTPAAAVPGSYVAWAEGPQERTEHGYLAAEHDGQALVLGLDGTYRQMPADIPEPEPDPDRPGHSPHP